MDDHTSDAQMLAVILASSEPERLYTGLSLLVGAAADGRAAHGLVSFGALPALLGHDVAAGVDPQRERFMATLRELREIVRDLDGLWLWACTAAVEDLGADHVLVEAQVGPITTTPRFVAAAAGGQLVVA